MPRLILYFRVSLKNELVLRVPVASWSLEILSINEGLSSTLYVRKVAFNEKFNVLKCSGVLRWNEVKMQE